MTLPYGDRLSGHTITVINRSEVVGRPLAALLANDGASVYSVDITGVQQFTRGEGLRKRRHEAEDKPDWTMDDCLPLSDVIISGVPSKDFKVPLDSLKDGVVCINFSSEKVLLSSFRHPFYNRTRLTHPAAAQNFSPEVKERASIYVPTIGKVTIVILLRNLLVRFLNLFALIIVAVVVLGRNDRTHHYHLLGRGSSRIEAGLGYPRQLPSFEKTETLEVTYVCRWSMIEGFLNRCFLD